MMTTATAFTIADGLSCGRSGCPCQRRNGAELSVHCPAHEDKTPSLSVTQQQGAPLVHCHAGCSQEEVIAVLRERGLWPDRESEPVKRPPTGRPDAEYQYIGSDGQIVAVKGRFRKPDGDKSFAWRRPGHDGWVGLKGLKESELPLYNAHLLAVHEGPVLIVEGEKAADACRDAALLALCPPGGASTKDFGRQLEPLAGRDVILWPDNDDPGRALMHRIARLLEGVAASVRTIAPEVPPKADAFDYFGAGGTKEALLAEAAKIRIAPWLEETATGYRVGIPFMGGCAIFQFDSLEERRHVLEAEALAWVEISGYGRDPFSARLNLLSLSNRDSFRRGLDEMIDLGKGAWTSLLNRACAMVREAHARADPSVDLAAIPDAVAAPLYMAQPFILAEGPTTAFGMGGALKTYLALHLSACITTGRDFLGHPVRRGRVLYLDYESAAPRIKARLQRVLNGLGEPWGDLPFTYWPGRGRPLPEILPALQRRIRESDVSLIIVDSAALACGGEPEKGEPTLRYFNSLAQLEVPSLTLAHITKDGSDQHPFGSVFWTTTSRLTWNIKLSQEEGHNIAHAAVFNRKSNEDRLHPPFAVRVEFDAAAVRFVREDVANEWERQLSLPARIKLALKPGQQSVKELADYLDASEDTVGRTLRRMSGLRRLERSPDTSYYWGLSGE